MQWKHGEGIMHAGVTIMGSECSESVSLLAGSTTFPMCSSAITSRRAAQRVVRYLRELECSSQLSLTMV